MKSHNYQKPKKKSIFRLYAMRTPRELEPVPPSPGMDRQGWYDVGVYRTDRDKNGLTKD